VAQFARGCPKRQAPETLKGTRDAGDAFSLLMAEASDGLTRSGSTAGLDRMTAAVVAWRLQAPAQ